MQFTLIMSACLLNLIKHKAVVIYTRILVPITSFIYTINLGELVSMLFIRDSSYK